MEVNSERQCSKKRRKNKKASCDVNETVVRPEFFDGMTNWLKLQQVRSILSYTIQFILEIFFTFPLFLSILCDNILQSIAPRVRSCVSFVFEKVLKKTSKEENSENSIRSGEKTHFKKPHKKRQEYKRNPPNRKNFQKIKPQFKFDFDERKDSLVSAHSDLSDHEMDDEESMRLTKTVSIDCEMVGTGPTGDDSILARVSIVNAYGECVYDTFVKPMEEVTDYRTFVSGVRPSDLVDAKDLFEVQKEVFAIISGRRVVGHALNNDFEVLFMNHPRKLIRDTSKYKPFKKLFGGRTPSLKKLTAKLLGCEIQGAEHSSIEDAQAAMLLYLTHKKEWEKSLRQKKRKK